MEYVDFITVMKSPSKEIDKQKSQLEDIGKRIKTIENQLSSEEAELRNMEKAQSEKKV